MKAISAIVSLITVLGCLGVAGRAIAGGGGENMLLVVNPNDPASLQIANAYAALRDIPANNILFIAPPADYQQQRQPDLASGSHQHLSDADRQGHLRPRIDEPDQLHRHDRPGHLLLRSPPSRHADTNANSLNYALDLLTPLTNGSGLTLQNATLDYDSTARPRRFTRDPDNIPIGDNPAILHSATYSVSYSGAANYRHPVLHVGHDRLHRHQRQHGRPGHRQPANGAASDGTRPAGTIYFEDNGDIRSTTRDRSGRQPNRNSPPAAYPGSTRTALRRHAAEPQQRPRRGLRRSPHLTLPNGSTYLPGSWADNLTSYGCDFPDTSQTKATAFIAAGAAGTTGSVIEPYVPIHSRRASPIPRSTPSSPTARPSARRSPSRSPRPTFRCPWATCWRSPLPTCPRSRSPPARATMAPPREAFPSAGRRDSSIRTIATGISTLELLVDGLVSSSGTLAGGSGTFNLNTAGLSDGVHEVRIVGINNSQAASEGYTAQEIVVNNHGRSDQFQRRQPDADLVARRRSAWPRPPATARCRRSN